MPVPLIPEVCHRHAKVLRYRVCSNHHLNGFDVRDFTSLETIVLDLTDVSAAGQSKAVGRPGTENYQEHLVVAEMWKILGSHLFASDFSWPGHSHAVESAESKPLVHSVNAKVHEVFGQVELFVRCSNYAFDKDEDCVQQIVSIHFERDRCSTLTANDRTTWSTSTEVQSSLLRSTNLP
jgi:hypothetical protein